MNKGNYYKIKTKKWFEKQGYFCDYLEKLQRIYDKKRDKVIFIKKDIAGADGFAMNGEEIIFWNAKFNKDNIAKGIREFIRYPYPKFVQRWIIVWERGKREPEIVEIDIKK